MDNLYETCVGDDRVLKDELLAFIKEKDKPYNLKDGWYERGVFHSTCFGCRGGLSVITIQVSGTPSRATLVWHIEHQLIMYSIGSNAKHRIVRQFQRGSVKS